MSSPRQHAPTQSVLGLRGWARRLMVAGLTLGLVGAASLTTPTTAAADPSTSARSGNFYVTGAGFGHGWGMSQYGAYGAARKGLTWKQILAFYYPRTVRQALPSAGTIRVWVTADSDGSLSFKPAAGARVTDGSKSYTLPTGSAYATWRISRSGSGYKLSFRSSGGSWKTRSTGLGTNTWKVTSSSGSLRLVLPSGSTRGYRGTLSLIKRGSSGRSVNTVSVENYVRAVVPSEMPTSWHPDAVRAQAVAARTYGAFLRARSSSSGYDICDTTSCQVYRGMDNETANGDAAVKATAHVIMAFGGKPAYTQFTSSNGGQITTGDYSYQIAQKDPYDGLIKSQTWSRTISASRLGKAFGVGTAKRVQITKRDGYGKWGGRVTTIKVTGTKRSVTVSGTTFKGKFGMRGNYFTVNGTSSAGKPQPATPTPTPQPVVTKPGAKYAAFPRSYRSTSRVDLLVITGDGSLRRHPVSSKALGTGQTIDSGYGSFTHVINAGDWNGDGYADVIGRSSRQRLLLYRGTSTGSFGTGVDLGVVSKHQYLTGVGDLNGDRFPDLMVIGAGGAASLLYGNGATGVKSTVRVAGSWSNVDWLRGAGDFNADGRLDVITRTDDRLYVHLRTTTGFAARKQIGSGFGGYSSITAVGDVDGDRRSDLVARSKSGKLRLFRSTGTKLVGSTTYAGSFSGTRFAI
ncbi:MAG TPA: SpoIID/LytB domain-containing protein [Microlunatus sp.]|nr:SpoIID/LytB domain-containing protein [Microlunatus sp.]